MFKTEGQRAIFWSLYLWVVGGAMILGAATISDSWLELGILTLTGIVLVGIGIYTFRERQFHRVTQTVAITILGVFSLLLLLI